MKPDELVSRRKKRAIAKIMTHYDNEVKPALEQAGLGSVAAQHRRIILNQINDLAELCTDIVKSSEADKFEFNAEVWADDLEERIASTVTATLSTVLESRDAAVVSAAS